MLRQNNRTITTGQFNMKFCSDCGANVNQQIPDGDNRLRFVCDNCHIIHYQNPKIIVGCIPEYEDKVLLCRRAIEPRHGKWTLPAGFMENGETVEQGAMRETMEEANAQVEIIELFTLFSVPRISQVLVLFRAKLLNLDYYAGIESLEVKLMRENEIPWQDLAFSMIETSLQLYFKDKQQGKFNVHRNCLD